MTTLSDTPLNTMEQKVSYGFGLQFGQQLRQNQFDDLDLKAVYAGIEQCFKGLTSQLSEAELNEAYEAVKSKKLTADTERAKNIQQINKQFLEKNAQREGVQITNSGLQYEILEAGDGEKPNASDTVRTHYHGTFIDGRVFDSSLDRDQVAEFAVNQVIPGWTEALQMMSVGAKWRIAVPAEIAYGDAGSPPVIPGNSALVFDIHLIAIL